MRLDDRIAALVAAAAKVSWLVDLTFENISRWIELELGQYLSDPKPQPYGNQHCQTYPLSPILHIVSGNTPHAALQSLIRGVIVGATNWIKLPTREFQNWTFLSARCRKNSDRRWPPNFFPTGWRRLRSLWCLALTRQYGSFHKGFSHPSGSWHMEQKVSLGLIWGQCDPQIAEGIARDVFPFDQLGCLSPQFFYVAGDSAEFALQLSHQLERQPPRILATARGRETAGALRAFREEWKFRAATDTGRLPTGKPRKSRLGGDSRPGARCWSPIHCTERSLSNQCHRTSS